MFHGLGRIGLAKMNLTFELNESRLDNLHNLYRYGPDKVHLRVMTIGVSKSCLNKRFTGQHQIRVISQY